MMLITLALLSSLLMLSYQNCQGLDSQQLAALEANGSGLESDTDTGDTGFALPDIPTPPIVNPEMNLCHDKEADVDWNSGFDFYNEPPSDPQFIFSGPPLDGRIHFKSSVSAAAGSRMVTTGLALRANPGAKGLLPNSDSAHVTQDRLANPICNNIRRISGDGGLRAQCTVNANGDVAITISEAMNNQCVAGVFELTVQVSDTCGAEALVAKVEIVSENICPPMSDVQTLVRESDPKPIPNSLYGMNMVRAGDYLAISAEQDSSRARSAGAVFIYRLLEPQGDLELIQKITPSNEADAVIGRAIAMTDSWLALAGNNQKIYIYEKNSQGLFQQKYFAAGTQDHINLGLSPTSFHGKALAISGNLLISSTTRRDGPLYVHDLRSGQLVGNALTFDHQRLGANLHIFRHQGREYLAASDEQEARGRVHIFKIMEGTEPVLVKVRQLEAEANQIKFGATMTSSDSYLAIAEGIDRPSPSVRLFATADITNENITNVNHRHSLSINNTQSFGRALSFTDHGGKLFIASSFSNAKVGAIYSYDLSTSGMAVAQPQVLPVRAYAMENQELGSSIVLYNSRLFAGAPRFGTDASIGMGRVLYIDLNEGLGE